MEGDSFLESVKPDICELKGRITAPATTGPARHPRPASSTPAVSSSTLLEGGMVTPKLTGYAYLSICSLGYLLQFEL